MAIVQISQITNRKGLNINLPQLAGAELGWSTDSRQLYIGNGTLEDGAPVIGNTEILTEFSDILNFTNTYTYKGEAAGYTAQTGPTADTPVTQSLQSWMDQFATVKDFGAVGDGLTDDTAAINRALYQLFCRNVNPQIRRSLFFPAGVYRVTSSINIPPYATLWGEGSAGSIIAMDEGINDYVARTADSNQSTGINIGNSSAIPPKYITITNMGFTHLNPTGNVVLIQDAANCRFQNVGFTGASTQSDLTSTTNNSIGVSFASTIEFITNEIVFDGCTFSGLVWGSYTNQQVKGVVFSNSKLDTLYRGLEFGTGSLSNGGPTGVRIVHNLFDNIYSAGITFGSIRLNATGYNIFYDVGNHFLGAGNPFDSNIEIDGNNNVSIGDMFQRNDADATVSPRINLNDTISIATTNGEQIQMGSYNRTSGLVQNLINNNTATVFDIDAAGVSVFSVNYTILRGNDSRSGTLVIASQPTPGTLTFSDEYVENSPTGVTINVTQSGSIITVGYTTTNTGVPGLMLYSITFLV